MAALERTLQALSHPAARRLRTLHQAPRAQERLDRRRRRVGVRHRLRWPGPRAGLGPERQHPRPRHRGLLEHRRPGLQGHPARRRGEVRGGREGQREEGSRPDGGRVRERLRGADCDGRVVAADDGCVPRSRGARRAVDHHRLQSLHRAWHQHALRHAAAETRGRERTLAALPLQTGGGGARAAGVRHRFAGPVDPVARLRLQRDSLQDALLHQPGRGEAVARPGAGRRQATLARLLCARGAVAGHSSARPGRRRKSRAARRRCRKSRRRADARRPPWI